MKKLLLILLLLMIVPSVNALITVGEWDNNGRDLTANKNDALTLNYAIFSTQDRFSENYDYDVKLYKNDGTFLRELESGRTSGDVSDSLVFSVNEAGDYIVTIHAKYVSGRLEEDSYYVNLKILDIVNTPPVITSSPVLNAVVNQLYSYDVNANDADNDVLVYSLTTSPNWLQINNANGMITGTPTTAGSYNVNVRVSDGKGGVDEQAFTIVVSSIIPGNNAPVITSSPVLNAVVNQLYSYDVDASDADNDALVYSLTTTITGMNIDANTGLITWTPANIGNYDVNVRVSDNKGGIDEQSFTITVREAGVNNAPVITSLPVTSVYVNTNYIYDVEASDADNDALAYSLITAPDWLQINNANGMITGTPNIIGDYNVVVRVSDGNLYDEQSFVINVLSVAPDDLNPEILKPFNNQKFFSGSNVELEGKASAAANKFEWRILLDNIVDETLSGIKTAFKFVYSGVYQILFRAGNDGVWSDYAERNIEIVNPDLQINVIGFENNRLTLEAYASDESLISGYEWNINNEILNGKRVSKIFAYGAKEANIVLTITDVYGNEFFVLKTIDLTQFKEEKETSEVHKIRLNDMTFVKSNNVLNVFVNVRNEGNNDEKVNLRVYIGNKVEYDSFTLGKNDVLQRHFVFRNIDDNQHVINAEATIKGRRETIYRIM